MVHHFSALEHGRCGFSDLNLQILVVTSPLAINNPQPLITNIPYTRACILETMSAIRGLGVFVMRGKGLFISASVMVRPEALRVSCLAGACARRDHHDWGSLAFGESLL